MAAPNGRKRRALPGAQTPAQIALAGTGLSDMEQTFILEFWRTGSPARAYRIAFEIPQSVQSTKLHGEALLRQPHIRKALDAYRENLRGNQAMMRERGIEELMRIAFFDPRNLYREDGSMKPINELDPEDAAAISAVETVELFGKDGPIGHLRKVKWADKVKAIKDLFQIQGWSQEAQPAGAQAVNPLRMMLEQIGSRSALPVVLEHHEVDEE